MIEQSTDQHAEVLSFTDRRFAERYGLQLKASNRLKLVIGAACVVVVCVVVGYFALHGPDQGITSDVVTTSVDGRSVTVTFDVSKPENQNVVCTLQADDAHGTVVGTLNVLVPAGRADEVLVATVNTRATPNTASVSRCLVP